jgi:exonuclease SbcC
MQNTYLFIRGSIGIKEGLGLDEIEFDLSDKTGLVALSGPNGRGKSTTLELMSLYRTMASRKGKLRNHFFLRDSRVEKKFIHGGDEYHLIWKIDSGSDRSEAFVIVNSESKVDGKNKEYDKFIIEKFGSQNLFYNSVFCAQGSGNMSTMTTGEVKELFVEFLRIARFEDWRKKSKAGVEFYQKKLDVLSGEMDICINQMIDFGNLDEQIKDNGILIADKELLIDGVSKDIAGLEDAIIDLSAKSEKQKADIERKKEIETVLKELISKRNKIHEKIDLETHQFCNSKALIQNDIETVDIILADKEKIFNAASRIENLEKWEQYFSGCYECAIDEQAIFDSSIKDYEKELLVIADQTKELEDDLILDGLKTTLNWLELRANHHAQRKIFLDNQLKQEKNDFLLMQATTAVTTCKEKIAMAINPECNLICPAKDIIKNAQKELPELKKREHDLKVGVLTEIKKIEDAIAIGDTIIVAFENRIKNCSQAYGEHFSEIDKKIDELKKDTEHFTNTKKQVVSDYLIIDEFKGFYKSKLSDVRTQIKELKVLSSKKSQIEVAEEKKSSLATQIKQLEDQFQAWETEQTNYFDELSKDILSREDSISKIDESIDDTIDETIKSMDMKKTIHIASKKRFIKTLDELKAAAAILKNDYIKKETLVVSIDGKRQLKGDFEKDLNDWDYLRLACSKTGLQALEIDGAAPLVTAEANTLFSQAYDLDWQIKIITQDPETGKEVFWIKVIRDGGKETDFSNLSGGEKVWIAKALSLGMTLVSKKKSGRDFQTVFADEEDGALDSEKALQFIQLYRSLMTTGNFGTCLFISHNPEVVAMADHVIDFSKL